MQLSQVLTYIEIVGKEVVYFRSIKSVSLIVPIFWYNL